MVGLLAKADPALRRGREEVDHRARQLYAQIRPAALKNAMNFYEAKALDALSS
jgi:hypothetical protein